jgi:mannose-6-phosphate isomerase-like protein (cupin superfamily)
MTRVASVMVWVVVAVAIGLARQTAAPPAAPPAPPPGSPATFKAAADLAEALRKATPTAGGMTTSPVSNTDQYRINIVHRAKPAGALAHAGNTELHYIVEGSGTVVTGGTIVKGPDGTRIDGGETRRVAKGDVIVVPAGSPHWYSAVDGTITYLEVRWLAPPK